MLSNLDDFPIHQTSEPMRHVATSDRNFYDRYYFNGFNHDGTVMFVCGLGVYPKNSNPDIVVLTQSPKINSIKKRKRMIKICLKKLV